MSNHTTIHLLKAQRESASEKAKACLQKMREAATSTTFHDLRELKAGNDATVQTLTPAINAWEEEHQLLRAQVQEIQRYSSPDCISHSSLDTIERIIREFEQ